MTTELVLILGLYAFILMGVFFGDMGPIATFNKSAPRLAARIERNVTIGKGFTLGNSSMGWIAPQNK